MNVQDPDELTREQRRAAAFAGKAGVDYLPDDKCAVCGAVPWWTGKRFEVDHNAARHTLFEGEVSGEGDARAAARERRKGDKDSAIAHTLERVRPVRRATGDTDDD